MLTRLFLILHLLLLNPLLAAELPDIDEQVRNIAQELRCVVCQNLSVADSPSEMAQQMRGVLKGLLAQLIPQFTYNPEISEHLSFDFPIAPGDEARIAEVRASARNAALNEKRFAPMNAWLKKLEVL